MKKMTLTLGRAAGAADDRFGLRRRCRSRPGGRSRKPTGPPSHVRHLRRRHALITKWAAGKTKTAADFYTGGGGITGFQNGLAIAGDYMSAASFLGISGLVFASGLTA
jgi:hypothetical protein